MKELTTTGSAERAFREPVAILLKHGISCPISRAARDELADFASRHPDVPVYGVEVTRHRSLSDALAERLGVAHESPQAFVLRDGVAVWRAEHFDITAQALEGELAG
jgi:bacillithiol system protein YtxJ